MIRRPILIIALTVAAASSLAGTAHAAGELPRLTEGQPALTERFWFDDHSIGGDNHLGWHYTNSQGQSSDLESQGIKFQGSISVSGPGGLEVCGYQSGTPGWMRAYQAAPGDIGAGTCPASAPANGQFGWFRYIYANHSDANPPAYNRWHLVDLERFALVPLPTAEGGPAGTVPTVWDSHWGTCLNFDQNAAMSCAQDLGAAGVDTGVRLGATKITQAGDPDAQIIPVTPAVGSLLRAGGEGDYQVVALSNPYGLLKEAGATGSVSCVNVHVAVGPYGDLFVTPPTVATAGTPATCHVPSVLDKALTGPGGRDPMAGAGPTTPACPLDATTGHCWTTIPTDGFPNKPAKTNATGDPAVTPSVPIAQGGAIPPSISATGLPLLPVTVVTSGASPSKTAASSTVATRTRARTRRLTVAQSHTRTALRRVFGTGLRSLRLSCRLRAGTAATCTTSWRKGGARYSGHVYLRNTRVKGRLRWQYRVDITRRKHGRTTHVRRGYRTGGNA